MLRNAEDFSQGAFSSALMFSIFPRILASTYSSASLRLCGQVFVGDSLSALGEFLVQQFGFNPNIALEYVKLVQTSVAPDAQHQTALKEAFAVSQWSVCERLRESDERERERERGREREREGEGGREGGRPNETKRKRDRTTRN